MSLKEHAPIAGLPGGCSRATGQALTPVRDQVMIATKFGLRY